VTTVSFAALESVVQSSRGSLNMVRRAGSRKANRLSIHPGAAPLDFAPVVGQ
jgi:hypothetical protein